MVAALKIIVTAAFLLKATCSRDTSRVGSQAAVAASDNDYINKAMTIPTQPPQQKPKWTTLTIPQVSFSEFIQHSTGLRHLKKFAAIASIEWKYTEMLISAASGGYAIIPMDVAWTGLNAEKLERELTAGKELRRSFLMSRFVREEMIPTAILADGRQALRLSAINSKYVYARSEGILPSELCLTPQTFRPTAPRLLSCARVVTIRQFTDVLGIFIDELLLGSETPPPNLLRGAPQ